MHMSGVSVAVLKNVKIQWEREMKHQDNQARVRQAKADLKHMNEQSEKILGASSADSGPDENDPIEVLGKRIGRGIGYVIVIFLIYHLATTYFIK